MKEIADTDNMYEKIKEPLPEEQVIAVSDYDDLVGHKWFFRTVTYHLVGTVTTRFGSFVELEDASWVADSGRFMNAIKDGKLLEVEPVGRAYVNLSTVTDFFPWRHPLPLVHE